MLLDSFPNTLIKASKTCLLKKGEILFQQTDVVEALFFIIKGELCALRYQRDGKQAIMMRHNGGEIFAPASMNLTVYPCAGVAFQDSRLLQIPKSIFIKHLQHDIAFNQFYINSLANDLKKQCARSERLHLKSAKERVLHFITCESASGQEIRLNCPLSKWAEELGIEPESLYRTLSDMEKEGLIQRNKRTIKRVKR